MILKKSLSITILAFLLLSQAGFTLAQSTQAPATASKTPKVIQDCVELKPKYPEADKVDFSKPYANKFELNFRVVFERASNRYHAYVECVFEGMVSEMLGAAGGDVSKIFDAKSTPQPEWNKPESACMGEATLVTVLKGGSPETLIQPLLATYDEYVNFLLLMQRKAREKATVMENGRSIPLAEIEARRLFLDTLVKNEIQDSLSALDTALNSLKEMRKAFAMHVHFQCMLRNLEDYRRAMENLRSVVSGLPNVIENASMH
jgi:hypothetical protein